MVRTSKSQSNNCTYTLTPVHTTSVPSSQELPWHESRDPQPFNTLTNRTNMSNNSPNGPHSYWSSPYVSSRSSTVGTSAWSVHDRELSPKWGTTDSPVPRSQYPSSSSLPPHRSLIPCIPLPSQIGHRGDFILHPSLRSTPESSGFETVDLASVQHFVRARTEASHMTSHPSYLSAPATTPHLPSLTIVHPSIPWCITVHRSRAEYVTIADILYTLGKDLQIPLDPEWSGRVARHLRISQRDSVRHREMIRLDMLSGKTIFAGLSKSHSGTETWRLHVR
ncbi:hypothetical protein E1B28_005390 [Marasmius oreades]|uniref:DUF6699 domain-containing protein n=1 Tax=Marasmius oreades TaxID=181124 RepID=A0A9P7UU73_9AGAR|nr:uncharacterized protein E1B28_005390 [Marasmius oreades]KAG7094562.1 hypothetical protein E1B28_005390 [Marasmius oreades]